MQKLLFRNLFQSFGTNGLLVAMLFALLFATMRGIGMLGELVYRPLLPASFVLMALLPFIFLTKDGRDAIGMVKPTSPKYYLLALLYGTLAASMCFATGYLLFGTGSNNWFVSILRFYQNNPGMNDMPRFQLFIIFTIPAMIFSPIGEETFFRGFLQDALSVRFGVQISIVLESLLFGIVHIFHHGLIRTSLGIEFYPVSAILWILLMFGTAYGFAMMRKYSGSLWPAMTAHAAFNIVMNLFIFYAIYPA
jgi:membrane protease YdiL (CAAX protease family)